ncbi:MULTISPECIES: helix-turn-helix domain-containing protein [Pseudomonadota]|jgi:cytoskeletal protein RodZ|uniref:XRE family transcriptional regulator n=3 Tax=Gammaproteobacteria TaxID=1236 RepID=A0AAD0AG16_FAUOS|nr:MULTISPECIES: helix-turn-helix transcriptional regulator [Gammaproteobacteria]PZU13689.1 MAG: XRE family transcriptional regulator [Citromicrobium sp.]ATQ84267.1 XRE family transcriptional regulator [Moraxella osloensis]ATW86804.1 XRE family transcriptional regulator [Moraxella osloensis]MBL7668538.1 helix-turn-helix transcriptional regulator [Moraxella osloensis]MDV2456302.1 helix-turn-helix transcriptional regulator [Acinetobacter towneri]
MQKAITSQNYINLTSYLKKRRLELGLSMRDLGERIDQPHSFVQKLEDGQKKLDIYQYVQYCEALELDAPETLRILVVQPMPF